MPSAALVRELRLWKYPSTLSCKRPRDPPDSDSDDSGDSDDSEDEDSDESA